MTKPLSLLVMSVLGLDMIIGLGVFVLPAAIVSSLGSWTLILLGGTGILLSAVAVMLGALAQLTGRNGGPYTYLTLAFGPKFAVPVSWAYCLGLAAGTGCYLAILADMLSRSQWLGVGLFEARVFSLGCLAVIAGINMLGLGLGSRATLAVTVLKVALLALLCFLGLRIWSGAPALWIGGAPTNVPQGIILILFLCQGFEMLPLIAGEMKQPSRNLGWAMGLSLWAAIGLYGAILAGLCRVGALGQEISLLTLARGLGPKAALFVEGLAVLSILGLIAGRVLMIPRLIAVISEDRYFPAFLSQPHPRFGTPVGAIAVVFAVAAPFALLANFQSYANLSAMTGSCQFLVCSLCLLWLSWKKNTLRFVIALASAGVAILFLCQIPWVGWVEFGLLHAAAFSLYFLWRYRFSIPVENV